MLHSKFQGDRSVGSGEEFLKVSTIIEGGGHIGHVTKTILNNIFTLISGGYMKFGYIRSSGFRGEVV